MQGYLSKEKLHFS